MPQIKAKDFSFTYSSSGRPSIRDLDLEIEKGEFILLTGPSGCGKTTLCRCLNGLIPNFYAGHWEGEFRVCGIDITKAKTYELAKLVGHVFQNPENQLFSLSVEREIALGPENLGLPRDEIRQRVEWAMELVGISDLRYLAPYELSGGQQQKVAIASVLAMRPEILVLDEPTSFLDPKSAKAILETIARLNEELDMTVILVEHRLDLAARLVDRVLVMSEGRLALDGKPKEIFGKAAHLMGVGLPKVTLLFQMLREDGLEVEIPTTVEEASAILRGLLD
ncbi:MAG: ATP-binding cassette domain-containing protein [Candidatus Bathyarchaeia archaeon]